MSGFCKRPVLRHYQNAVELVDDHLAAEQCLRIHVHGREVGYTMSTPGMERELVTGYLFTEGHISCGDMVRDISFDAPRKGYVIADVTLGTPVETTDIGPHPLHHARISADQIFGFMSDMESAQSVFRRTGGTHSCALFDHDGTLVCVAEDIGRHNALDKVIGSAILQGVLHQACLATLSSRLSFELVCKAVAARLGFLCGISVATAMAVDMAESHGITLVGRIRGRRMNVYTHRDRVLWPSEREAAEELKLSSAS